MISIIFGILDLILRQQRQWKHFWPVVCDIIVMIILFGCVGMVRHSSTFSNQGGPFVGNNSLIINQKLGLKFNNLYSDEETRNKRKPKIIF